MVCSGPYSHIHRLALLSETRHNAMQLMFSPLYCKVINSHQTKALFYVWPIKTFPTKTTTFSGLARQRFQGPLILKDRFIY